jgi:hypothetical protein
MLNNQGQTIAKSDQTGMAGVKEQTRLDTILAEEATHCPSYKYFNELIEGKKFALKTWLKSNMCMI